jgi:chemotaxis protein CheC
MTGSVGAGSMPYMAKNTLEELGNIGAGNAATSLSVMLSSKLTVSPPQVEICDFNTLKNKVGGAGAVVVGVLSTLSGDIDAMILFVLGMQDAKRLVDSLMGKSNVDWHSEIGMSAIKEIANILMGSYVSSLGTLSGLTIRYSVPQACIDMAGSILSVPCIEFGMVSDNALLINSQFKNGEHEINGYIMVLSEMHSFNILLNKLGIGGIDE